MGDTPTFSALRRLLTRAAAPATAPCCELCGAPLPGEHSHVADTGTRRLLCVCAGCAPRSTLNAAMQAVSSRYVHGRGMQMSAEQWADLEIPVDLAFIFYNAALDRFVVSYPGPAGAVESLIPLERWQSLSEAHPWARTLHADVEAVLARRAGDGYQCFVVPIDRCYELVGRVRSAWSGFDGGDAVRLEVDRFFADLAARCGAAA